MVDQCRHRVQAGESHQPVGQQFMDALEISRQRPVSQPGRCDFKQSEDRQPLAARKFNGDAEEGDSDQQHIKPEMWQFGPQAYPSCEGRIIVRSTTSSPADMCTNKTAASVVPFGTSSPTTPNPHASTTRSTTLQWSDCAIVP